MHTYQEHWFWNNWRFFWVNIILCAFYLLGHYCELDLVNKTLLRLDLTLCSTFTTLHVYISMSEFHINFLRSYFGYDYLWHVDRGNIILTFFLFEWSKKCCNGCYFYSWVDTFLHNMRIWMIEWLLLNVKWAILFSYIMARTSYISMKWWCSICTTSIRFNRFSVLTHWNSP